MGDRIDAVAVVDVTVAVVVEPAVVALGGIHPHVGGEIDTLVVDAGVDDGNDHAGAAGGDVPGGERADIRSHGRGGAELTRVAEVPTPCEERIVRDRVSADYELRLDALDTRLTGELRGRYVGVEAGLLVGPSGKTAAGLALSLAAAAFLGSAPFGGALLLTEQAASQPIRTAVNHPRSYWRGRHAPIHSLFR